LTLRPSNLEVGQARVTFERSHLHSWTQLEEIRSNILEAARKKDLQKVNDLVISYILTASKSKEVDWDEQPWYMTLTAYEMAFKVNMPTMSFPILKVKSKENKKQPWEYPGRNWYYWLNTLCKVYGWSKEQVENLEIDDGIGLLQEILIDEQMQKEWEWGISEVSHGYNADTKKSEFHELPRPEWMKDITPATPKRFKMLKSMLPAGIVNYEETSKPTALDAT
jgi:hypothetical protein